MSNKLRNFHHRGFQFLLITLLAGLSLQVTAENVKSSADLGNALAKKLCQACHNFTGADQPGNVAPPFISMKARYPDREKVRAIIFDPQVALKNDSMMPPFGRHVLATKQEIELIIDFLYTQ